MPEMMSGLVSNSTVQWSLIPGRISMPEMMSGLVSKSTVQWSLIPGRISMPEMMSGLVVSVKSNILSFLVGWSVNWLR